MTVQEWLDQQEEATLHATLLGARQDAPALNLVLPLARTAGGYQADCETCPLTKVAVLKACYALGISTVEQAVSQTLTLSSVVLEYLAQIIRAVPLLSFATMTLPKMYPAEVKQLINEQQFVAPYCNFNLKDNLYRQWNRAQLDEYLGKLPLWVEPALDDDHDCDDSVNIARGWLSAAIPFAGTAPVFSAVAILFDDNQQNVTTHAFLLAIVEYKVLLIDGYSHTIMPRDAVMGRKNCMIIEVS